MSEENRDVVATTMATVLGEALGSGESREAMIAAHIAIDLPSGAPFARNPAHSAETFWRAEASRFYAGNESAIDALARRNEPLAIALFYSGAWSVERVVTAHGVACTFELRPGVASYGTSHRPICSWLLSNFCGDPGVGDQPNESRAEIAGMIQIAAEAVRAEPGPFVSAQKVPKLSQWFPSSISAFITMTSSMDGTCAAAVLLLLVYLECDAELSYEIFSHRDDSLSRLVGALLRARLVKTRKGVRDALEEARVADPMRELFDDWASGRRNFAKW
jgi:hypothetical protein